MVAKDTQSGNARFGTHALVYLVSMVLMRGLSIFLTPFYTRVMSPEDFATIAIANTLTSALSIVFGLALYACIPRLYYDYANNEDRRRFLGTLLVFALVLPVIFGLIGDGLGRVGALDRLGILRFRPFFQLVIWTSALSSLSTLPSSLYTAFEQPRKVSLFNISSGVGQLLLNILLVAILRQGAVGVLRAGLLNAGLTGLASVVLMWGHSRIALSLADLRAALRYCVPLVPHLLANWALSVSDRIILAAYVTSLDLGRYSLACLVAAGVSIVAAGVITPINPAANRQLEDPETAKQIPPLGSYALVIVVGVALLGSVCSRELIRILAPPSYAEAADFVPWVVAGAVFQGAYLVLATGTWYSKKTAAIPLVTLASVAVNVGINLVLIPRYGVIVAAISTTIGYAVSALLHGLLAYRNFRIPWEYRRWAIILVASGVSYALIHRLVFTNVILAIMIKSALALLVYAAVSLALGFIRPSELRAIGSRLARR